MSTLARTAARRSGLLATGALATVLVATLAGPAIGVSAQSDTAADHAPATLSVDGTGRVKVTPDVADIMLGVRIQRDRAADAAREAAASMESVIAALREAGIADEDIQTVTLALNPVYDYNRTPALITGYEAANIVAIVARDLETTGDLIDAAIAAGATSIDGISFRLEDTTAVEEQARAAAVAAARAKADTLAGAAGVEIVGILAMSESYGSMPTPIYYGARAEAAMDMAMTPVLAGSVEIAITVMIQYEIAPAA